MEEITLKTWEEFETKLAGLHSFRKELEKKTTLHVSDFLFRGQANSQWHLATTLDRFVPNEVSLAKYYNVIYVSRHRIETFTESSWSLPSIEEYKEWLGKQDKPFLDPIPAYDYMAYLRHQGFPSPLLDWTSSPYVASFFAFQEVTDQVGYVSVYVFLEYVGGGKLASTWEPTIHSLGEYVRTHKRHFLQQSLYTVCTQVKEDGLYYARHEDAPDHGQREQDRLWKFNIATSERAKVLKKLDAFNINSFSLFGTEESLMDTIATREFLIKERYL